MICPFFVIHHFYSYQTIIRYFLSEFESRIFHLELYGFDKTSSVFIFMHMQVVRAVVATNLYFELPPIC